MISAIAAAVTEHCFCLNLLVVCMSSPLDAGGWQKVALAGGHPEMEQDEGPQGTQVGRPA